MSLNFDLTEVKKRLGAERYEHVTTSPDTRDKPEGERKWHPITDTLIWRTMAVDLGEITESNIPEWVFRLRMLQLCGQSNFREANGAPELVGGVGSFFITEEDVRNHIGLRTNVTTKTRDQWLKRQFGKGTESRLPKLKQAKSALDAIDEALAAHAAAEKEAENA